MQNAGYVESLVDSQLCVGLSLLSVCVHVCVCVHCSWVAASGILIGDIVPCFRGGLAARLLQGFRKFLC